jgi:hypothetical protein
LVSSGASASSQSQNTYLAARASSVDTQDAQGGRSLFSLSTPAWVNKNTVVSAHPSPVMKDFGIQHAATMTAMGTAMTPDRVGTLQVGITYVTVPAKAIDNVFTMLSNAEHVRKGHFDLTHRSPANDSIFNYVLT